MLDPFPDYQRLHTLSEFLSAGGDGGDGPDYFSDAYYFDLLVWYHLAWSGESARREEILLQAMIKKESDAAKLRVLRDGLTVVYAKMSRSAQNQFKN